MSLGERLNLIIKEQKMTKRAFAKQLEISEDYVYLLTGNTAKRPETIAHTLAKLIEYEFGYNEKWILYGEGPKDKV